MQGLFFLKYHRREKQKRSISDFGCKNGLRQLERDLLLMANVILLRVPSQDSSDRYENAFKSLGYNPVSIPVLQTVLTNLEQLTCIVSSGPVSGGYDGVIITSGRACEGWRRVVEDSLATPSSKLGWR